MDEITLTPAAEENEPQEAVFATVAGVYSDGLSLLFDGAEEASQKHYLCNTAAFFSAGDRVKLCRDSGTIVVEYPIGRPRSVETHGIPPGGTSGQVLAKNNAADYAVQWADVPHELPTGGSKGQALCKKSATNYDVEWGNPKASGVFNQYNPSGDNDSYIIQFRTSHLGANPSFQIRMGTSGAWKTITIT